jgi:cell division septum initiation protein DivIVA
MNVNNEKTIDDLNEMTGLIAQLINKLYSLSVFHLHDVPRSVHGQRYIANLTVLNNYLIGLRSQVTNPFNAVNQVPFSPDEEPYGKHPSPAGNWVDGMGAPYSRGPTNDYVSFQFKQQSQEIKDLKEEMARLSDKLKEVENMESVKSTQSTQELSDMLDMLTGKADSVNSLFKDLEVDISTAIESNAETKEWISEYINRFIANSSLMVEKKISEKLDEKAISMLTDILKKRTDIPISDMLSELHLHIEGLNYQVETARKQISSQVDDLKFDVRKEVDSQLNSFKYIINRRNKKHHDDLLNLMARGELLHEQYDIYRSKVEYVINSASPIAKGKLELIPPSPHAQNADIIVTSTAADLKLQALSGIKKGSQTYTAEVLVKGFSHLAADEKPMVIRPPFMKYIRWNTDSINNDHYAMYQRYYDLLLLVREKNSYRNPDDNIHVVRQDDKGNLVLWSTTYEDLEYLNHMLEELVFTEKYRNKEKLYSPPKPASSLIV